MKKVKAEVEVKVEETGYRKEGGRLMDDGRRMMEDKKKKVRKLKLESGKKDLLRLRIRE